MVKAAAAPTDRLDAYLDGIARAGEWSDKTHEKLQEAVNNDPYGVWTAVERELLGETGKLDSRQSRLKYGGTTDRVGRGTVIKNMHNAAWGAIFSAYGMRHSQAQLLDVVVAAGRNRDEAFQPRIESWEAAVGTVTGPVFSYELWNGKKWVDRDRDS